jgi:hypothetical protein
MTVEGSKKSIRIGNFKRSIHRKTRSPDPLATVHFLIDDAQTPNHIIIMAVAKRPRIRIGIILSIPSVLLPKIARCGPKEQDRQSREPHADYPEG